MSASATTEALPTRRIPRINLLSAIGLLLVAVVLFWILFWADHGQLPPNVIDFELCFIWPDLLCIVGLLWIASYWLLAGDRRGGTVSAAAGGALFYLGLLDVMFSYREFDAAETDLVADGGEVGVGEGASEGANEFPLAVATVPGHLALTVDSRSISRPNAERLTAMYRAVLEAMAADPEGDSLATHLPQEENDRMLGQWNDTAVEW